MSLRTIVFYISGHGYGHAVRESFLIEKIPLDFNVHIISSIPQSLFEEEISRPFGYQEEQFDLGCVQKDAVTVDIEKTLTVYEEICRRNKSIFDAHLLEMQKLHPIAIVSDIVPFASTVAMALKVPSFAISNFSWYETYEQYCQGNCALLDRLKKEYEQFTYWIRLSPGTTLPDTFRGHNTLSKISLLRKGRKRRGEMNDVYGFDPQKRLVLLYTGTYGLSRVAWEKLADFDDYHFIGYYPIPYEGDNFTVVHKEHFTLQDFSASADLIISKLGYGTVTESLSSGTPFLYVPRENFIEFPALQADLERGVPSIQISEDRFNTLDFHNEMSELITREKVSVLEEDTDEIINWILERL